jgi:amidophosphoribosyltransferase
MNKGLINPTEMVAALINQKPTIVEGLKYAQEKIKGSMSILLLFPDRIYAARDKYGRTPIIVGKSKSGYCVTFESSAYQNLGFTYVKDLGPGEIVSITNKELVVESSPNKCMKMCSFLWTYYGYPTATYEGRNVEVMRYKCGELLRKRDEIDADGVAGVPDSGVPHAIGYANQSGIPYSRPFIKYTPTWPRSFMPTMQSKREMIAKMKLIPVHDLIKGNSILLIDDSIVRGTQLKETTEFLYQSGAKEVHIRPACPPILFGCKYLNFSRSKSELDLITRQIIQEREGDKAEEVLQEYTDPNSERYAYMLEEIRKKLNFTTLKYLRLDDMIESIGIEPCKVCTYCFNGQE